MMLLTEHWCVVPDYVSCTFKQADSIKKLLNAPEGQHVGRKNTKIYCVPSGTPCATRAVQQQKRYLEGNSNRELNKILLSGITLFFPILNLMTLLYKPALFMFARNSFTGIPLADAVACCIVNDMKQLVTGINPI